MILEEIDGNVVVTVTKDNGKTVVVAIGEYISDHECATISVIGVGKATVRADPNCTIEFKGIETETEQKAPVEVAPVEVAPAPAPVEVAPAPVEVVTAPEEVASAKKA